MNHRFNRVSAGLVFNILINAIKRRLSPKPFFRPSLPSFFATLRCNLNCSYCGLVKKDIKELPTKDSFRLLEKIRPHNAALSITGGEPLVRNDILDILEKAKALKFAPIFFNTNALLLHKNEDVLKYVDYLIVSLDSLNEEKWDGMLGIKGAAKTIIGNIKTYSKLEKHFGFKTVINSVITPENIPDIYEIIDFCTSYDLFVSPVPEDQWTSVNPALADNLSYRKLITDIITMKKNGNKRIAVSDMFLGQILDFKKHNCFPTLVPRIYPDGSVFYPCTPIEKIYGNLLDYPDLNTMMKEAYKREFLPECTSGTKRCFMSCFMEPTNMIENPLALIRHYLR